jgi:NAD(P)H-flavin reductase
MYWHCNNEGNSWYYMHASVAVFSASLLGRLFFKTSSIFGYRWIHKNTATIQSLGLSMVKISVFTKAKWVAGQHAFLRFPSVKVLANHPFTIVSICDSTSSETQEMVFLVRPQKGFSAVLHSMAVASPSSELTLSIDVGGPYGGLNYALERRYDSVILVAGGGGISAVLPELLHLSQLVGTENCITREIILVWAIRHGDALRWVREQLAQAVEAAPKDSITLKTFVTRGNEVIEKHVVNNEKTFNADEDVVSIASDPWSTEAKRPNLSQLIPSLVTLSRTFVLGMFPTCTFLIWLIMC